MKIRVEVEIKNREKYYLVNLFPVKWTNFVSSATYYNSIEEARSCLNSRFYNISESLGNDQDIIKTIQFVFIENGVETGREYYI